MTCVLLSMRLSGDMLKEAGPEADPGLRALHRYKTGHDKIDLVTRQISFLNLGEILAEGRQLIFILLVAFSVAYLKEHKAISLK